MLDIVPGCGVKRFSAILCLLLWGLSSLSSSASAEVIQKPEFSLTLPDGWEEAPQEVLKATNDAMSNVDPSVNPCLCMYQITNDRNSSSPLLIVKWQETKRIPRTELKQREKDLIREASLRSGPDNKILRFGVIKYDQVRDCLSMESWSDTGTMDESRNTTAMFLTEKGILMFQCSEYTSQPQSHSDAVSSMIHSVVISHEIAYRNHWWEAITSIDPVTSQIIKALMLLIGAIAMLFRIRSEKSRQKVYEVKS